MGNHATAKHAKRATLTKKSEFTMSDPTLLQQPNKRSRRSSGRGRFIQRKLEIRKDAKSVHEVPSQPRSVGYIHEPLHVGNATLRQI